MTLSTLVTQLKALVPTLPVIIQTTIQHLLGLSPCSQYMNLRCELIIACMRHLVKQSHRETITAMQARTLHDSGIKGRVWVAKTSSPFLDKPDVDALLATVKSAIEAMAEADSRDVHHTRTTTGLPSIDMPQVVPVEAEWTGYRFGPDVTDKSLPPQHKNNAEIYANLVNDCTSPDTVILYLHGGGYCLHDPAFYRPAMARLSELSGARVYNERYRLAPQNPFPAALIDALVSYLTLLYPPDGALHEPVPASRIVFCGDSAGGNLSLALLQFLLQLRRTNSSSILWQGQQVDLPLPAGVAANSPWVDITMSFPSWNEASSNDDPNSDAHKAAAFDCLPSRNSAQPWSAAQPMACAAWPTSPPRATYFAPDALLTHPLANLAAAPSWTGAPPMWLCCGEWERLAAEIRWLAIKIARDGSAIHNDRAVTQIEGGTTRSNVVYLDMYEAMPHVFTMILPPETPEVTHCFESCASFVKAAVADAKARDVTNNAGSRDKLPAGERLNGHYQTSTLRGAKFSVIKAKSLIRVEKSIEEVACDIDDEAVRSRLRQEAEKMLHHATSRLNQAALH